MKATDTRQLLAIGLKTEGLVTFFDYVESRRAALGANPAAEMRRIYQTARQLVLVLGNQFSLEAKLSFPIVHHDYSLQNLCVWAFEFRKTWIPTLTRKELILFRSLQFMPPAAKE